MKRLEALPAVDGACEKCAFPLAEHGAETGRCRGHARIRDEEGKAIGLKPCGRWPVKGAQLCRSHGVNRQHRVAAARHTAIEDIRRELKLGQSLDVDPAEAMLDSVREARANVEVYRYLVELLTPNVDHGEGGDKGLTGTLAGRTSPTDWKAAPHVYVAMYNDERDRLVRYCKMCREAGVEEHRVQLADRLAGQLVEVQTAVVTAVLTSIRRLMSDGGVTEQALAHMERVEVPRLVRGVVEARVLKESA